VRSFLHAAEQSVMMATMITIFTILFGLPGTRRIGPLLITIAFGAAVLSIDLVRRARELLREGFGADDVRRAFELERRAHAEEMRQLFDERRTTARRRTRRRAWITLAIGILVRLALQMLFDSRTPGTTVAPWIALFVLTDVVNAVSFVVALNASPRSERRFFRVAASLWRRRFTNGFFRLAGIGLGNAPDATRARANRLAPTARLVELIPASVTQRFPELRALVEGLERQQDALRVRETEIGRSLTEAGGERERPVSAVTPMAVALHAPGPPTERTLHDRRAALLGEMRDALDEVRSRRAAIGAALENLRIQLLRVRAGIAAPDDLREEVDALRAVGEGAHSAMAR
jgi:hypothetical protein